MLKKPTDSQIEEAAEVLSMLEPGFLPKQVFEQVTRMCVTPIIEIVPLRKGVRGTEILLLKRPDDDSNWPGQLHAPGTVLRSTDVSGGFEKAFKRISTDELGVEDMPTPVFVDTVFHVVSRGAELANVFYVDLTNTPINGDWHLVDELPDNVVDTQLGFIKNAIKKFTGSFK